MRVIKCIVWHDADGMIMMTNIGPYDEDALEEISNGPQPSGGTMVVTDLDQVAGGGRPNIFDYYVDLTDPETPVVTVRPTVTFTPNKTTVTADGVDKVTIPSVPADTVVRLESLISPTEQVHTGGTLELAFTEPGTKEIVLDVPGPTKPFKLIIEAVE
jgi:hypothetical protein